MKNVEIDSHSFNYNGYTQSQIDELLKSCVGAIGSSDYIGASNYNIDILVKKYGYFPRFLPICVSNDHGLSLYKDPVARDDDDKNNMPLKLVFNEYRKNRLRETRKYKVETLIFPMIFYRRSKNIQRVANPKGTLVFVGHNFPYQYEMEYTKKLIHKIKSLNPQYSPVCVCVCRRFVKWILQIFFREWHSSIYCRLGTRCKIP